MKIWPAIVLLVFLSTSSASAQQPSTAQSFSPQPPPARSGTAVVGVQAKPYPDRSRTGSIEVAERHSAVPDAEPEDDPLGQYHLVHNERIHQLRQRAWRNVFANPVYLFDYWYTSRKGITLLHFRRGRVRVGFETQRVQVPGDTRGYSDPVRAMDACHAFPSYQSGICRPLYFHEGERRYSVTLRLNFGR